MNDQKNQGHSLSICHPHIKFDIKMYGITGMHFEPCLLVIVPTSINKRRFQKKLKKYWILKMKLIQGGEQDPDIKEQDWKLITTTLRQRISSLNVKKKTF